MKRKLLSIILLFTGTCLFAQKADTLNLSLLEGEYWWGGLSSQGHKMPYDANSKVRHDFWGDNAGNQAQPLLLSSKGRYIWSENPIKYTFESGKLTVTTRDGKIQSGVAGNNLKDAYHYCVKNFFPPNGVIPDEQLFTKPQFNTWIELQYDQNQEDILKYAHAIIDNGFPPGIIMIDDTWQQDYGVWDFDPRQFNDPKAMMDTLHAMGFKVMLWICPFISADSREFRYLQKEKMLLLEKDKEQDILWADSRNKAAIIRWWNGASACLDLSNPEAQAWFKERLDYLQEEYGVDGYKFDAGDAGFYTQAMVSYKPSTPNDHTTYFAEFGLNCSLNEYRASWKMAGLPLAQRLADKNHDWNHLQRLIPDIMSQSLMGYAYTCPDMIGGGQYLTFLPGAKIDEELVVRSAQVHALMPMMQFSVAPWRILSDKNSKLCVEAANLHLKMADKILELANNASKTGEPIAKPMALVFPDAGYETIEDQFMLGDDILVAPVVKKGEYARNVVLPKGKWKADDGTVVKGGKIIKVDAPIERLPYFIKIK